MTAPSSSKLPKILCLHGGGTSAAIFQVQTLRLRRLLQSRFHFVFVDGPATSPPGPGVLPVFEGCDPFLRWEQDLKPGEAQLPAEKRNHEEKGRCKVLEEALKQHCREGEAPFVGVMGFSQGGRVATALLERQPRLSEKGRLLLDLKFGVFLNATYPPMPMERWTEDALIIEGKTGVTNAKISIPTVHVHGLRDPWLGESRELVDNCYVSGTYELLEFGVGHQLPTLQPDIARIAEAIEKIAAQVLEPDSD